MTIRKPILTKLILLFSFSAIIIGCSSGTTTSSSSSSAAQNNVTGFYYAFDESGSIIVDSSGNDFHGTATAISRDVDGQIGGAVKFLQSGSVIELPVINSYFPFETGFSFRAWIKVEAAITDRQQIIGGSTNSDTAEIVSNFGISLIDDSISFEIPVLEDKYSLTTTALSFPTDTWFHIAITYDGSDVSFYYNGDLVATDSVLTTYSPYFQNRIGNNQRTLDTVQIEDQFIGFIDELYLENVVLTESEIANYYLDTM